jgi:phosphomannomutase/phosphoglucomutase
MIATPEIILKTPDDVKFEVIETAQSTLQADYKVITVDGARVQFPEGWGLVRASNTQPAITMRFEAKTKSAIVEYMQLFKDLLADYPQIDMSKLDNQIQAFST